MIQQADNMVFLSYSFEDSEIAFQIHDELEARGINTWMAEIDIPHGIQWDMAVQDALLTAEHMIVLHSDNSSLSVQVWDEWSYFLSLEKRVIPVIFENVRLPYRLHRLKFVDLVGQTLDEAIDLLVAELIGNFEPTPDPSGGAFVPKNQDNGGTQHSSSASANGHRPAGDNNNFHNSETPRSDRSMRQLGGFLVPVPPERFERPEDDEPDEKVLIMSSEDLQSHRNTETMLQKAVRKALLNKSHILVILSEVGKVFEYSWIKSWTDRHNQQPVTSIYEKNDSRISWIITYGNRDKKMALISPDRTDVIKSFPVSLDVTSNSYGGGHGTSKYINSHAKPIKTLRITSNYNARFNTDILEPGSLNQDVVLHVPTIILRERLCDFEKKTLESKDPVSAVAYPAMIPANATSVTTRAISGNGARTHSSKGFEYQTATISTPVTVLTGESNFAMNEKNQNQNPRHDAIINQAERILDKAFQKPVAGLPLTDPKMRKQSIRKRDSQ